VARAKFTGPWGETRRRLKDLKKLTQDNASKALHSSAKLLVKECKQKIKLGDVAWEPLAPITVALKGHSKSWENSGSVRDSIKYERVNKLHYDVGIPANKKNKYGVNISMIATVQEFGKIIVPKHAKALAIPLNQEAQRLALELGGVGNIPGLFRLKGRNILARRGGAGGGVTYMFLLKRQIKIPARSVFRSTWEENKDKVKAKIVYALHRAAHGKTYNPR